MGRAAPRRAGPALREALDRAGPDTDLAAAQREWPRAVGEGIAQVSEPVRCRDGVLTVRCRSAIWAQELSQMESELRERLAECLAERAPSGLRFLAG